MTSWHEAPTGAYDWNVKGIRRQINCHVTINWPKCANYLLAVELIIAKMQHRRRRKSHAEEHGKELERFQNDPFASGTWMDTLSDGPLNYACGVYCLSDVFNRISDDDEAIHSQAYRKDNWNLEWFLLTKFRSNNGEMKKKILKTTEKPSANGGFSLCFLPPKCRPRVYNWNIIV